MGRDETEARLQLLLVTDDPAMVADALRLLRTGHAVTVANGAEAFELAVARLPDVMLIERDLVECSALGLCRRLRRNPATQRLPIVIFTARGEDAFATAALQGGADAAIGFATGGRELLLRARRLADEALQERRARIRCGALELDETRHRAWLDTRPLDLNATELRLLKLMMLAPERVHPREDLLAALGDASARHDLRKVDWYISRVRRGLELAGGGALIATVRAEGYALRMAHAAEAPVEACPAGD